MFEGSADHPEVRRAQELHREHGGVLEELFTQDDGTFAALKVTVLRLWEVLPLKAVCSKCEAFLDTGLKIRREEYKDVETTGFWRCPCGGTARVPELYLIWDVAGGRTFTINEPAQRAMVTPGTDTLAGLRQLVEDLAGRQRSEQLALQEQVQRLEAAGSREAEVALLQSSPGLLSLLRPSTHEEVMEQVRLLGRVLRYLLLLGLVIAKGDNLVDAVLKQVSGSG